MRVLISAYACEPHFGSEGAVGWNFVRQAARQARVTVITRANNRPVIEEEMGCNPEPNLTFEYFDLPDWAKFWKRGERGLHAYYTLWQAGVAAVALRLHARAAFDVVHHLTLGNCFLWPGVSVVPAPFVWGPIGMDPVIPVALYGSLDGRTIGENVARQVVYGGTRLSPHIVLPQLRAAKLITTFEMTRRAVLPPLRDRVEILGQIQVPEASLITTPKRLSDDGLKLISCGRLVSKKGFFLTIEAFAIMAKRVPGASLTITGDGPLREDLETLSRSLGVSDRVVFAGRLPSHGDVIDLMDQHSALLFPTFEAGGMVVVEAMARGLPAVALPFGGPGDFITPECGLTAPPDKTAVPRLAEALERLALEPRLYERLSEGAIQRVRSGFLVESLGETLARIYSEAVA